MLERHRKEVENNIYDISRSFAIRIVKLYGYLTDIKKENVMSKQLLRAGTSVGANVCEARNAQSRPDFASKMNIALKEAGESLYWLDLLHETNYMSDKEYDSIYADSKRIVAVLTKIVKATKSPQKS